MNTNQNTDNRTNKMPWWFWVGLLALAVAAIALFFYLTPDGIGLVNDSVAYIGGARSLMDGQGYSRLTGDGTTRPITNYPPLFPLVIAFFSLLGWESIAASAVVNALLLGANTLLLAVVVLRVTRQPVLALLAGGLLLASAPLVGSHLFAMSEPLYLALMMTCLLLLAGALERGSKWLLFLAGAAAGLAFVTRYVGVSLFITALLAIVVWNPTWRARVASTGLFLLGGLPAPLAWLIRNRLVTGTVANRALLFHPIPADNQKEGLVNFWGWLLPETGGLVERFWQLLGVLFILGMIALSAWAVCQALRMMRSDGRASAAGSLMLWLVSVLVVVYLAVLVLTMLFLDASPIFEHRILAPIYLLLLIIFFGLVARLLSRQGWAFKALAVALVIGFFLSTAEDAIDNYAVFREGGQGFASASWTESLTLAETKTLPDVTIYTNRQSVVYLLADRAAYILPSPINPATLQPRESYAEDLANIRESVLDGRGVIVVFQYEQIIQDPQDRAWLDEVSAGLPVFFQAADGIIWGDPER